MVHLDAYGYRVTFQQPYLYSDAPITAKIKINEYWPDYVMLLHFSQVPSSHPFSGLVLYTPRAVRTCRYRSGIAPADTATAPSCNTQRRIMPEALDRWLNVYCRHRAGMQSDGRHLTSCDLVDHLLHRSYMQAARISVATARIASVAPARIPR